MPENPKSPFAAPDEPPFIAAPARPPEPKIEFSVIVAAPNRRALFDWLADCINYYRNPDRDPNDSPNLDADFKPGDIPVKFSATFNGVARELADWLIGVSTIIGNSTGGAFRQNRLGDTWTYEECKVLPEWAGKSGLVRRYSYWTDSTHVLSRDVLVQTLRAIASDALIAWRCADDDFHRREKLAFKSKVSERLPNEGPISFYAYFETTNPGDLAEKMTHIADAIEIGDQASGRFSVGGWSTTNAEAAR